MLISYFEAVILGPAKARDWRRCLDRLARHLTEPRRRRTRQAAAVPSAFMNNATC
jgi:hypothetical protein